MSLLDQFREGRNAQKKYSRIQQMKKPTFNSKKLPPWHPGNMLRGMGVVWEILHPVTGKIENMWQNHIVATMQVMKNDWASIKNKVQHKYGDPDYENYRRFLELSEGKR